MRVERVNTLCRKHRGATPPWGYRPANIIGHKWRVFLPVDDADFADHDKFVFYHDERGPQFRISNHLEAFDAMCALAKEFERDA